MLITRLCPVTEGRKPETHHLLQGKSTSSREIRQTISSDVATSIAPPPPRSPASPRMAQKAGSPRSPNAIETISADMPGHSKFADRMQARAMCLGQPAPLSALRPPSPRRTGRKQGRRRPSRFGDAFRACLNQRDGAPPASALSLRSMSRPPCSCGLAARLHLCTRTYYSFFAPAHTYPWIYTRKYRPHDHDRKNKN